MKPLSLEWISKAEGDIATARRELRARVAPNYDSACFHSQQTAEKYLKARLFEAGVAIPRTHSLTALLDLSLPIEPHWELHRETLAILSAYAVGFRYPGEEADRAMAKEALAMAEAFRRASRISLGLPTD